MTSIEAYRSFVAVVEYGGFNAAAEALNVAQPSLTRRLQRLESDLGVRLLERGPWGSRLTEQGSVFYNGARRILTTIEDVTAETSGAGSRTIRLGAAATAAGSYLAPRLANWLPEHPEVHLVLIEDGANRMRSRLEERECDTGIIAAPIPDHFNSRFITRVTVQALFPPSHPLTETREPLSVAQLQGERLLVNGDDFLSTDLLKAACRLAQVDLKIVYECRVGQTLAALAEGGLGIAVMGDSVDLRGFDLPRRYICDRAGNLLTFDLYLAWLRDRTLPTVVMELIETLTKDSR